jgi:bifunctional non-homologous end joining protein LigD
MARRRKLGTSFPLNATNTPFPVRLDVQLAKQVDIAPDGDRWLHEIKFDGYRLVGFRDGNRVWLRTRKMLDWTKRFPELVAAILSLPNDQFVIDGEVVALLPSGVSSFSELQQTLSAGTSGKLVYEVFDLLYASGQSLSNVPLLERKQCLHDLVHTGPTGRIRYVDHVVGDGPIFYEQCRKLGLEGVVSKRIDGTYVKGRTATWLKVKGIQRDDFVIGGYTLSTSRHRGLRALLVGMRSAEDFQYVGSVGAGFSEVTIANLLSSLEKLDAAQSPFANHGPRQAERGTRWIRPELVAAVQYSGRTSDDRLRHPVFLGLRDDLRASDLVTEPETVAPVIVFARSSRLSTRQRSNDSPREC